MTPYEVNEIVINDELIASNKRKIIDSLQDQRFNIIEAKMFNSVQVMTTQQKEEKL